MYDLLGKVIRTPGNCRSWKWKWRGCIKISVWLAKNNGRGLYLLREWTETYGNNITHSSHAWYLLYLLPSMKKYTLFFLSQRSKIWVSRKKSQNASAIFILTCNYLFTYLFVVIYFCYLWLIWEISEELHCLKSALIRSYFGPYFPVFGLNTDRYFLRSVRILWRQRRI